MCSTLYNGPCKKKMESHYVGLQEVCLKDDERIFNVLRLKFHILAFPCRSWFKMYVEIFMSHGVYGDNILTNKKRPQTQLREVD